MLSDPTIISFDTTGSLDSIALYHKGQVSCKTLPQGGSALQSSILVPSLQTLLDEKKITFQDVEIITTLSGPGSFTGIRIGLATAQGLSLAGNYQPVIPTLLEVLAFAALQENPHLAKVSTLVDSKRGDYFHQEFNADLLPLNEAMTITIDQFPEDSFLVSDKQIEESQVFVPAKPIAEILIDFCLHHALQKGLNKYNKIEPFYIRNPEFAKKKRFVEI